LLWGGEQGTIDPRSRRTQRGEGGVCMEKVVSIHQIRTDLPTGTGRGQEESQFGGPQLFDDGRGWEKGGGKRKGGHPDGGEE